MNHNRKDRNMNDTKTQVPVSAAPDPHRAATAIGLRDRGRPRRRRRMSQTLLEKSLRAAGWPYVAVDEAKKAIFATSEVESFDFIIYREDGPNLLVECGPRSAGNIAKLRDWRKMFGQDFAPAFARTRADGRIVFVTLAGIEIVTTLDLHYERTERCYVSADTIQPKGTR